MLNNGGLPNNPMMDCKVIKIQRGQGEGGQLEIEFRWSGALCGAFVDFWSY